MKTGAKDSKPVQLFKTRSKAQKIGFSGEKKLMNFLSSLLTRNEIRLDVTKKSLLRLPLVTRVLEATQEFFKSKNS